MNALSSAIVLGCLLFPQKESVAPPGAGPDMSFGGADAAVARLPEGTIRFPDPPPRDWRDCFGNTATATLTGVCGATVFLTINDEVGWLPLISLRSEDLDYVLAQLNEIGESEMFLGAVDREDAAAGIVMPTPDWFRQLDQWAEAACDRSPEKAVEAKAAWNHLRAIRDPQAMKAVSHWTTKDADISVRLACVESLASIGGDEAMRKLVKLTVSDRHVLVRHAAMWSLCQTDDMSSVWRQYASFVASPKHREMALLNLYVLASVRPLPPMSAPDSKLVDALIASLTIKQARYVPYLQWTRRDTGVMIKPYGGTHRETSTRTKVIFARFFVHIPCELARKVLVQYTQRDFKYDQEAWRKWKDSRSFGGEMSEASSERSR